LPSGYSGIVVAARSHAGADGDLDEEEIALLAGTMVHEAGHYLGLNHVVETDVARWDIVEDTIECEDEASCEDELGDNLMYPVRDLSLTQEDATDGQRLVLHGSLPAT
jgi:hypothetical protein